MSPRSPALLKRRALVQACLGDEVWATSDHWVFRSPDRGRTWAKAGKLAPRGSGAAARARDWLLRSAPVRRLRGDLGIAALAPLRGGTAVLVYDRVYRLAPGARLAEPVFDLAAAGAHPPLLGCIGYSPEHDTVAFGDYQNARPYAAAVYAGVRDGRDWRMAYRFPEGRVKHIHCVTWDRHRGCFWIATGDRDEEVGLFRASPDFSRVELFQGGDQSWRMVSLVPTENHLYWGSDAGKDAPAGTENALYRWDFRTGRRETLGRLGGPAYYSMEGEAGDLAVATCYEPGMPHGDGPRAELWYSRDGSAWERLAALPWRDAGRARGTRYATLLLPSGRFGRDGIPFTALNVEGRDFDLMRWPLHG